MIDYSKHYPELPKEGHERTRMLAEQSKVVQMFTDKERRA